MTYQVFARKYRPQTFTEVVGQDPIISTLKNSIKESRVAQSFLFSGTRGVGKTSTARILAKALNCLNPDSQDPCNQCEQCQDITDGRSMDVLEIDGASNRGIDDIRNLRENVKFKPANAKFKIYIIDEVHMLTTDAFNALLKTLEEPPSHVKFIFATTELHKVPSTILSRCQKFEFRKVPASKLVAKLKEILVDEKIEADEKSLYAIARSAEGSLRDAESLLDQIVSFSQGSISYEKTREALGQPDEEIYITLIDAILKKNTKDCLETFTPLALEGKDMHQLSQGLTEMFRTMLILKAAGRCESLFSVAAETLDELETRAKIFSKEDLLSLNVQWQKLLSELRRNPNPHMAVETFLIKACLREELQPLSEILEILNASASPLAKSAVQPSQVTRAPLQTSRPAPQAVAPRSVAPSRPTTQTVSPKPATPTKTPTQTSQDPSQTTATAVDIRPFDLSRVEEAWGDILEAVKMKKISCGSFLAEGEPISTADTTLTVGLAEESKLHCEVLDKVENKILIQEVLASYFGPDIQISFVITKPETATHSVSKPNTSEDKAVSPIVDSALKMFDGRIVNK